VALCHLYCILRENFLPYLKEYLSEVIQMGYQFLINKIYFDNDKAEPWDEDFKDFYRKKVAELENYNKEKTSLEYIKSLGAIGSEI
jgi:hypothetical protein